MQEANPFSHFRFAVTESGMGEPPLILIIVEKRYCTTLTAIEHHMSQCDKFIDSVVGASGIGMKVDEHGYIAPVDDDANYISSRKIIVEAMTNAGLEFDDELQMFLEIEKLKSISEKDADHESS
jgi:hypothetical protein